MLKKCDKTIKYTPTNGKLAKTDRKKEDIIEGLAK